MPDFEFTPGTDETSGRLDTPFCDPDDFADVPRPAAREGLPKAFRMRHASHYVEQVMGDAPLQTVRQIPIERIDRPDQNSDRQANDDLTDLIESIREVGVLQPLLVAARDGSRFELVAGWNRMTAAREAGLTNVPCLLVHADADAVATLRSQAERRAMPPVPEPVEPPPVPEPVVTAAPTGVMGAAFAEMRSAVRFISALAPIARTNESAARMALIVSAIGMEATRAATMAAAADLLTRTEPVRVAPVDCPAILKIVRAQIALEARLKGVQVTWRESLDLELTVADRDALLTGWAALVHAMLGAAREGDRLEVSLTTPRVRPAIILELTLHSGSVRDAAGRFFDTEWPEHPGGQSGAVMLDGARHSARLHGGRLSVETIDSGVTLAFVAPQPL